MRRSKWAAGLGLAVCLVLSLAGCGSKTQQSSEPIEGLDQLGDIQVIAREEGSGTRGHLHSLWDLKAMPERKPIGSDNIRCTDCRKCGRNYPGSGSKYRSNWICLPGLHDRCSRHQGVDGEWQMPINKSIPMQKLRLWKPTPQMV